MNYFQFLKNRDQATRTDRLDGKSKLNFILIGAAALSPLAGVLRPDAVQSLKLELQSSLVSLLWPFASRFSVFGYRFSLPLLSEN